MSDSFKYQGEELMLFENAVNWKKYFSALIQPHIHGKVLECGAGIGTTTRVLHANTSREWILLEPDKEMAGILKNKISNHELPSNCTVIEDTISFFSDMPQFDTILYIDVLEHIENDRKELSTAASLLHKDGKLIILSPAFPSLYSRFDKEIGHYRRYTRKTLDAIIPASLVKHSVRYLDSPGFFLSLANRILLKQSYPAARQIAFWDKYCIPVSKITDRIVNYSFGKSILGIWEKTDPK